MRKSDLLTSTIDFLLQKPLHLLICFVMMSCAVTLKRDAFVVHVFGVTFFLLVVLHKINMCYGKIENKFRHYEYIVLAGGVVHTFVPVVGLFFPVAMMVHIGICFSVHILHLMQCYQVFIDMKMKDDQYIFILWAVNIAEFLVNLAFAFPEIVSDDMFVVCLIVVEVSALLISSLKLSSRNADSTAKKEEGSTDVFERAVRLCISRVFLLFWTCIFVALLTAYHRTVGYIFFMIGFLGLVLVAISKFHHLTGEFSDTMFTAVQLESLLLLPLLSILTALNICDKYVGVSLVILSSVPSIGFVVHMGYIVLGQHFSFHVGLVFLALYFCANVCYMLLKGKYSEITELFQCFTLAAGMIFCLVENRNRKVNKKNRSRYASSGANSSYYSADSGYKSAIRVHHDIEEPSIDKEDHVQKAPEAMTRTNSEGDCADLASKRASNEEELVTTGNSVRPIEDGELDNAVPALWP